jgi:hypothetical protein
VTTQIEKAVGSKKKTEKAVLAIALRGMRTRHGVSAKGTGFALLAPLFDCASSVSQKKKKSEQYFFWMNRWAVKLNCYI